MTDLVDSNATNDNDYSIIVIADDTTGTQRAAVTSENKLSVDRLDRTGSGSLTALNTTVEANTNGLATIGFSVTGTWVGTISVQGSLDGSTFGSVVAVGSGQAVFASTTSNDNFRVSCGGFLKIRLIMSAYTSGTANVLWNAGIGVAVVQPWNTNATSLKVAPRSDTINSTGSAGSLNADLIAAIDVGGYQTLEVQVTGTWVGTLTFQGSEDNSTFFSILGVSTADPLATPSSTTTANGTFYVPLTTRYFRMRMTAYSSGTATGAHTFDTLTSGDVGARNVRLTDGVDTAAISSNADLFVVNVSNNSGTQGALTVSTSAVAVNVSGSNLANRKLLTLHNNSLVTIYWGYTSGVTTSSGTPLAIGQFAAWSVGPSTTVYAIAAAGSNNTRVTESA